MYIYSSVPVLNVRVIVINAAVFMGHCCYLLELCIFSKFKNKIILSTAGHYRN